METYAPTTARQEQLRLEIIGTEENAEEALIALEAKASAVLWTMGISCITVVSFFIYSYL